MREFQYFISYSRDIYYEFVNPLNNILNKIGLKTWIDKFEINIGDEIIDNLYTVLDKSADYYGIIFILDETFFSKAWCLKELNYALKKRISFFPVLYKIKKEDIPNEYALLKNYNLLTVSSLKEIDYIVDRFILLHLNNIICRNIPKFSIDSYVGNFLLEQIRYSTVNSLDALFIVDNFSQYLRKQEKSGNFKLTHEILFCIAITKLLKERLFRKDFQGEYHLKILEIIQEIYIKTFI
ncbi:TPA: toll/interleukin-1 receptor domain-containing protein [Streptococcus suis]|uniref:toll/interleukin-1 receptor domain-containing protein n=1 Tax=Streptococcus suis TaxID=1307 RepID=UPI000CF59141|nr:toll/interleukin-1 receptor domain-containing protein [Streptococcus suis]HEM6232780.1 toll/interleukin-1 receptor domain-containing protein [Streptococcus suis]HEM6334233.1 toll/interleukin-1 receptor domain-containing protein [Streptococcus suis]HEM6336539.1 toll/interleukin-1 receptor domain-containing protein [Streptococcus suis]HEM6368973.1 toll/interleukin-1 receptor domain-containing protein [Streptococcus suis]